MTGSLNLIHSNATAYYSGRGDSLLLRWVRSLAGRGGASAEWVDIAGSGSPCHRQMPYRNNLPGWKRWFQEEQIQSLYILPDASLSVPVFGACLAGCEIHLACPGRVYYKALGLLRLAKHRITAAYVPADFAAMELQKIGIGSDRIHLRVPDRCLPSSLEGVRERLCSEGPVLITPHTASEPAAIKIAVWTAAILRCVYPGLRLIIPGRCVPSRAYYLRELELAWGASGMIYLDDDRSGWPDLLGGADLLIISGGFLYDVIPLLYARDVELPIVSGPGLLYGCLKGCSHLHPARSARPRSLAETAYSVLETVLSQRAN